MQLTTETRIETGMPTRRYKPIRPKDIRVGNEYRCTSANFKMQLTVRVLKLYDYSYLAEIIQHDPIDDYKFRELNGKVIIPFKRVIDATKEIQQKEKKIGRKTIPIIVNFADGHSEQYESVKETIAALGYKPRGLNIRYDRYIQTKKHGLVYIEKANTERTKSLNFEFNKNHGRTYVCLEYGKEIARGTIRQIAAELGQSRETMHWVRRNKGKWEIKEISSYD